MNDELETLKTDNIRLTQQLKQQQRDSMSRHSLGGDSVQLDFIHAQQELSRCKEALIGSLLVITLLFLVYIGVRINLGATHTLLKFKIKIFSHAG